MLINDTSLLTKETLGKLNAFELVHINTGREPLTEETALALIECLSTIPCFTDKKEQG